MIEATVEVDRAQVADALAFFEFVGGNADEALRVAINKAGPKVKTASSKAIREQVRLTAAYVNKQLTFKRATRADLSGAVKVPSRGILLSRFSTDSQISGDKVSWLRPPPIPKRGIRVKIKPSGQTEVMGREWFYMVLPKSRSLGIVRRLSSGERSAAIKAGSGVGSQGGKFDVAYGPSVSQVFGNETRERLLPGAGDELQRQFLDAMRYLLQKKHPA